MSLELIRAFGLIRPVTPPSPDRRRFGVPVGGPFDRESAGLAMALVEAPFSSENSAFGNVWELGMASAVFRCLGQGTLAVVGAPCSVSISDVALPSGGSFPVCEGDEIRISPPVSGARTYAAYQPKTMPARRLANLPESCRPVAVRVVAGPQSGLFDLDSFDGFRAVVAHASDRVGVRLAGIFQPHTRELPSEPACVGAIQVTGSGELVILGPDGPTIGGYPKVAVVIDADLDRVGQLRPGDPVAFEVVSLVEARRLAKARAKRLGEVLLGLRIARDF